MPFSQRKVHELNIHGHPEEFTVAVPFESEKHVGGVIPPNEIEKGSVRLMFRNS